MLQRFISHGIPFAIFFGEVMFAFAGHPSTCVIHFA
jgi:hypothetical protein